MNKFFKGVKIENCSVSGCEITGSVKVEGFRGEIPLCSKHYDYWGYYLAGADREEPVRSKTVRFNYVLEGFLKYCREQNIGFQDYKEMLKGK